MKRVEITWRDAAALHMGWASRKAHRKAARSLPLNRTVGYLLAAERGGLVVVMTDGLAGEVNQAFLIPRGMVKRIRKLR